MITGMENTYKADLITKIKDAILANTGTAVATPNVIDSLAEGVADSTIPFFTSNAQVPAGIPVTVSKSTGIGATTGTGSLL